MGNDNDDIKPYTAVGAALDSATRFKRRMNYGRITPNPSDKRTPPTSDAKKTMPRYMKPTEAYSRRTSRSNSIHNESDSAELRKRYPHWYQENDRDDRERRDSDDRKSPEYRRKSPSPERDYSDKRESRDRQSPEYGRKSHYPHRDYREKSPSPERDYRERRES